MIAGMIIVATTINNRMEAIGQETMMITMANKENIEG
jgi:hypothetical protein